MNSLYNLAGITPVELVPLESLEKVANMADWCDAAWTDYVLYTAERRTLWGSTMKIDILYVENKHFECSTVQDMARLLVCNHLVTTFTLQDTHQASHLAMAVTQSRENLSSSAE